MNVLFEFLASVWIISISYGVFIEWVQGIDYREYLKKIKGSSLKK